VTSEGFSIKAEDPEHCFDRFMPIMFGHEVRLSPAAIRFVRSVAGRLWNSELFELPLTREGGQIEK
jgi:hypothetical protein